MSQFGYAEEPGENKASADIYAVISPLVIPPGIQRVCYCVLYQKTGIVALFCIWLFTRKQPTVTNVTVTVRNEADKKKKGKKNGASAAQFFIIGCERG